MTDAWVTVIAAPGGALIFLMLLLGFGLVETRGSVRAKTEIQNARIADKDEVIEQGAEREKTLREIANITQAANGHLVAQIGELMPTVATVRRILEAIEPLLDRKPNGQG